MRPDQEIFYRRRLPHYQPPNETFHVTFRLAGSLPQETILRLKREHQEINKSIQKVRSADEQRKLSREWGANYFDRFDEFLDRATDGPFWLREDAVAARVAEIMRAQDGKDYDLLAYCLMPNHVHLLATFWQSTTNAAEVDVERSSDRYRVTTGKTSKCDQRTEVRSTVAQYFLADALKKLKGVSAYECNKLLNRRDAFWQHESYDHVIRDEAELERTVWYILENPVKAGLCSHWRDWKWTYMKEGLVGF
jgi:REP element-mobilizing transposase RayT